MLVGIIGASNSARLGFVVLCLWVCVCILVLCAAAFVCVVRGLMC